MLMTIIVDCGHNQGKNLAEWDRITACSKLEELDYSEVVMPTI